MTYDEILGLFQQDEGKPGWVLRSPGRVNIIGEHTDYNNGYVLPFAANRYVYFVANENTRPVIHIHSSNFGNTIDIPVQIQEFECDTWQRYFQSSLNELLKRGFELGGLNIFFGGNNPIGAGLSSSSSITCGFIQLLNLVFSLNLSSMDVMKLASCAENSTGLEGGQMDQFTILHGIENHAIFLDCGNFEHETIPLNLGNYQFILFNTNVRHSLVSTEYNTRRKECDRAFDAIKELHPSLNCIKEVSLDMLEDIKTIDPTGYRRLKHFIEENKRVVAVKNLLFHGNVQEIGKILDCSHISLRDDYEVSCEELDFLVDKASECAGFVGGRMMGGGFGGCTVNIVEKGFENTMFETLKVSFHKKFGKEPNMYIVKAGNGVTLM